ncbi:hypothetical protein [Alicycliphilus denitrificans]|uniref:hypothetical protein n=1 Tax=Alicycliphilus denitrificans TaxID=179636 RepID=UPI0001D9EDF2|nr:hypothetical protein [Alicycliphilus denitrificans]ADU99809.1 hypothetical protein Alide_2066 [Alicycliphilus denitrificans BC]HRP19383.1 hypothetical protein [Alicycliphilus sp.]
MGWLVLAVLSGLAVWVGYKLAKPDLAAPEGGDAAPGPAQYHQSRPNRSALQITVDGVEHDYTHHPLFQAIAPMMARGEWGDARRYLQKIAYGIKEATEDEQRVFKHIMMAFASVDPLYAQCLRGIAPILAEHPEGIRQTTLYPHMAAAPDAETARYVLYFADELGAIRRLKKGNSYLVFSTGSGPDLDFKVHA